MANPPFGADAELRYTWWVDLAPIGELLPLAGDRGDVGQLSLAVGERRRGPVVGPVLAEEWFAAARLTPLSIHVPADS